MYHIFRHWKHQDHYLYRYAMVVFLYAILNGIVSFILPVYLEETIPSLTIVGLILASSSIWNIVTDFVLGLAKKSPSYRGLTQLVGMILFGLFIMIWLHVHIITLIIATVLWGVYTELFTFANFDYVVVSSCKEDRAGHFGLMTNFRSLGFALAPIMIGVAVAEDKKIALFTGLFFSICMIVLFQIQLWQKKLPDPIIIKPKRRNLIAHLKLWKSIGRKMAIYLWVYFVRGVADGVLTSFVPIFVEMKQELKVMGGFIVAGLSLPTAFVSGYFGSLADRYGRKKFILFGIIVSTFTLFIFGFILNPYSSILLSLLIGIGYSLYAPALDAEIGEYVEKHHSEEAEVESESGVVYNLGFIFGAGVTGLLVSILGGFGPAFAILGLLYGLIGLGFWLKK